MISSNVQFLKRNPFYHNPRLSPVNISKCCEQVCCKICMQKGSLLSTDFQSQCLVSSSSSSLPPAPWPVSPCPPPTGSLARLPGSHSRSRVGATAGGFSQAWCATSVNIYGSHQATGQWGFCDSSCPGSSGPGSGTTNAATATGPCVTIATPNGTSGKRCRFPFTYQGQTYTQCTKAGGYPQAWCATANNIYGSHQATGQWGYCANTCAGV